MTRTPSHPATATAPLAIDARLLVLILALLACAGLSCGGSDKGTPGRYQSTCDAKHVCNAGAGLICVSGLCTKQCNVTSDCAEYGAESVCDSSHCYDTCLDTLQCPSPLVCTQSQTSTGQTCRTPL